MPLVFGAIVDHLSDGRFDHTVFLWLLGGYVLARLGHELCTEIEQVVFTRVAQRAVSRVALDAFRQLHKTFPGLPPEPQDRRPGQGHGPGGQGHRPPAQPDHVRDLPGGRGVVPGLGHPVVRLRGVLCRADPGHGHGLRGLHHRLHGVARALPHPPERGGGGGHGLRRGQPAQLRDHQALQRRGRNRGALQAPARRHRGGRRALAGLGVRGELRPGGHHHPGPAFGDAGRWPGHRHWGHERGPASWP